MNTKTFRLVYSRCRGMLVAVAETAIGQGKSNQEEAGPSPALRTITLFAHLWGPSAANLAGTQLAGAAIGLKGSVPSPLGTYSYDVFAGTPIHAPSGFPAPSVTIGFQVSGQF